MLQDSDSQASAPPVLFYPAAGADGLTYEVYVGGRHAGWVDQSQAGTVWRPLQGSSSQLGVRFALLTLPGQQACALRILELL